MRERYRHSLLNSQSLWIVHHCPVIVLVLVETSQEPPCTTFMHFVH